MGKKAYVVFSFLALLLCAACFSLFTVSTGAEYVDAAGKQSLYKLDVAKSRGTVYDCTLTPITGAAYYQVAAVAPTIETVGVLNEATGGQHRARLAAALEEGKPFLLETDVQVKDECIDLFTLPRRYSETQLAPHVVGYLDSLGGGAAGIELAMNDLLSSFTGELSIYYQVDALGRVIAGGKRQVVNTLNRAEGGVALTIDSDIQRLAQQAAESLNKGAVVVTAAPDCEIKALASAPSFSPLHLDTAAENADSPFVNRAFSAYAPGSVFKLVTAAVELEKGASPGAFTCTGYVNSGGLTFQCIDATAHGELTLEGALAQSCNCYFINSARGLGGQSLLTMGYNLGLGVGQEFGRGFFTAQGLLPDMETLENPRGLANFSFGQGALETTPVQLCAMMNAIVSQGVYHSPRLILGQVSAQRRLTELSSAEEVTRRAMSISTARQLTEMLKNAVKSGTAAAAAVENAQCGAKTGTAQTGVFDGENELLNFWYCGFVTTPEGATYSITVLKEGATEDGGATAKAFRDMVNGITNLEKAG